MLILIPTLVSWISKFVPKRWKLFVLPENWHTWYLEGPDSEFGVTFIPSRIKCRIPGTRTTYSPVNFTREHLGQIIFLHFSDSLVNMSAKSLVNMLANHWWSCWPSHWRTCWPGHWWTCWPNQWWTCWPSH